MPLLLALGASFGLTGCVSATAPTTYQLQWAAPAPALRSMTGTAVLLGPVMLPDYLKHPTLIQRQNDGSLSLDSTARWAGSLQDNVDRVLLHQLAGYLNSSRLVFYTDRQGFKHDIQAQVRIDRFDSGPQQAAVLEAQWHLVDAQGAQKANRIVRLQEKHGPTLADQVQAQSQLLQKLAEQLARDIQWTVLEAEASTKTRETSAKPKTTIVKKRDTEDKEANANKPANNAPVPVRTDMEVFRF
ncbi:hypothetical protein LX59_01627 [Azomonas agilis]|uniref:ABC-type transport auxiliary lipoprotein component domain-containing protein n=1 Tax=Azomonas agilis TaxID=116849 RepID=A0A562IL61_9GAMM|nr:hypothetical protein LX59_01627 [Azomonas agilis]